MPAEPMPAAGDDVEELRRQVEVLRLENAVALQNLLREKDVPPEISSLEFVKDLLTSALTSTNADAYAQIVHEKAVLRKLIKVNEQIANDCMLKTVYEVCEVPIRQEQSVK